MWRIEDWEKRVRWVPDRGPLGGQITIHRHSLHQAVRWWIVRSAARLIAYVLNVPAVVTLDESRAKRELWDEFERCADPEAEAEEARQLARNRIEAARQRNAGNGRAASVH